MQTVKIMVFDNDEYFLSMLKGYCFANNVQIAEMEFNVDGINEVKSRRPNLILIPLDWISTSANLSIEINMLKLVCKSRDIKIYGLNKKSGETISAEAPEWIDGFINNPMNIAEIDKLIKAVMLYSGLPDRRLIKERRVLTDRRQDNFDNNGYNANIRIEAAKPEHHPHENGKSQSQEFHVDTRNKCLFLKGHRIDLTPKEFELVEYLSTDPNRIFSPDEIVKHLWPENHRATKSDLYQYIHLLRKKIEKNHNQPQLILNAKGFGYKLNVLSLHDSGTAFGGQGKDAVRV